MSDRDLLRNDLENLANERRRTSDDLPTAERLIALRDGTLGEVESEHLRDDLALDSELADVYLSLCRETEVPADIEGPSEDALDSGLKKILARAAQAEAQGGAGEVDNVRPFQRPERSRRSWSPRWLGALAAGFVMSLGLLIFRADPAPTGPYYRIAVSAPSRGSLNDVLLPASDGGLDIAIGPELLQHYDLDPAASFDAELLSADRRSISTAKGLKTSPDEPAVFSVRRDRLEHGESYELRIRIHGDGDWIQAWAFKLSLTEP